MMRSLFSGVSGLKTHQTRMDVIGNNIANVNTVAYKSSSMTFSELMYQTTQSATGANAATGRAGINAKQIGLGVVGGAINTAITTEGASQTTGNPFDLRITGDSFFVVSSGSENFFTRAGAFYVDGVGNLAMTTNGYTVMGWQPDTDDPTIIKKDTVSALRIMSAANLTSPPEATTESYISGIIDKNSTNLTSSSGQAVNMTFYDDLGYSYTAKYAIYGYTEGQAVATAERVASGDLYWVADAAQQTDDPKGYSHRALTDADVAAGLKLYSNVTATDPPVATELIDKTLLEEGIYRMELEDIQDSTGKSLTEKYNKPLKEIASMGATAGYELTTYLKYSKSDGSFIGYSSDGGVTYSQNTDLNDVKAALTFNLGNFPAAPAAINISFKESTMYDNKGTATIGATAGDYDGRYTGRKLGAMSGVSIETSGKIFASYDNGTTKLLGQIAVANFANASGLEKVGENLYSATQNSGAFNGIGDEVGADGTGKINSGVLEMSNVDLSSEFTEMITTQRGFQANSRIITVSDTMIEELVNLKR
ncbi:MAG: flagellar hook-basal body complex protein [bacterium]|nr:flagellar hook-basal body complex protein [bacterium]